MIREIYTFFVALFLAIFVGMGIAVFYPEPQTPEAPTFYGKELTPDEQKQQAAYDAKQREWNKQIQHYNRNVSVIVLACAVAIMTIALSFSTKLGVIANGLLLGGIFTLLYGIGRGMATDSNKYRFLGAAIGLAVTMTLGYIKFSRTAKT